MAVSAVEPRTAIKPRDRIMFFIRFWVGVFEGNESSYSQGAFFFGANPKGLVHAGKKDFPVADLARAGGLGDDAKSELGLGVGKDQLNLDLGQKIHGVLAAAIEFGMAFLAAEPPDLSDGHSGDSDFVQGLFNFIEFERFDYRFDFLHVQVWAR